MIAHAWLHHLASLGNHITTHSVRKYDIILICSCLLQAEEALAVLHKRQESSQSTVKHLTAWEKTLELRQGKLSFPA